MPSSREGCCRRQLFRPRVQLLSSRSEPAMPAYAASLPDELPVRQTSAVRRLMASEARGAMSG